MDQEQLTNFNEDPTGFIKAYLENLVAQSPENRLYMIDDRPIFEAPLVGFADGDDPLFSEYKERIIGPFHMTPREVLQRSLSSAGDVALGETGGISVICWALPFTKRTKASNATKEVWPSLRWAHSRYYGEQFNELLRRELVSMLTRLGHFAVAPILSPAWSWLHKYPGGPVSKWSERHALYAAGLGTFGLCDGFITPKGKAMRCGTVVVNTPLPATKRPYETHTDNCTFYTDGSCGHCIDRCPAGAITKKGHSRSTCIGYMREQIGHIKARYNADPSGCGLCQTRVPCSSRIPAAARGSQLVIV
jgi:epoxyqueuosine reductase QueG